MIYILRNNYIYAISENDGSIRFTWNVLENNEPVS